jgi:DNA-binding FrmR family transcriptional regulator
MEEKEGCAACVDRETKRTSDDKKKLINRLNRIEGQIRGVKKMLDTDAYCLDILIQVSAITAALSSFKNAVLDEHIHTCVVRDILDGKNETLDELMEVLKKLTK